MVETDFTVLGGTVTVLGIPPIEEAPEDNTVKMVEEVLMSDELLCSSDETPEDDSVKVVEEVLMTDELLYSTEVEILTDAEEDCTEVEGNPPEGNVQV